MNNRLRYWHVMVWFVSSMATARKKKRRLSQWTLLCDWHFASPAINCLISASSPKYCRGNDSRDGPTLKKPLKKQDSSPLRPPPPPPPPPMLTSTYQSCIVNLKYGLVKTQNFSINLMFYIVLKLKKIIEEKKNENLEVEFRLFDKFHIASVCFSLYCPVKEWLM